MKAFESVINPLELRQKLGLRQAEFWSKIGVTQSGGCRYEQGRAMPKPVRELLRLVHIEGIELSRAKREYLEVGAYIERSDPRLYRTLKKAASSSSRQESIRKRRKS